MCVPTEKCEASGQNLKRPLKAAPGLPAAGAGLHYCRYTSGLQGRHSFRAMLSQKNAPIDGLTCTKKQGGSRDLFNFFLLFYFFSAWLYPFPKHGFLYFFCSIFFPQKNNQGKICTGLGELREELWSWGIKRFSFCLKRSCSAMYFLNLDKIIRLSELYLPFILILREVIKEDNALISITKMIWSCKVLFFTQKISL